jgi:hypothetical protein
MASHIPLGRNPLVFADQGSSWMVAKPEGTLLKLALKGARPTHSSAAQVTKVSGLGTQTPLSFMQPRCLPGPSSI